MAEKLKTALIILLCISGAALLAVFFVLTLVPGILSPADILFELSGGAKDAPHNTIWESNTFVLPCDAAVMLGAGKLYSPTGAEEYRRLMHLAESFVNEALGSARNMTELTAEKYLFLLLNCGIMYRYDNALPVNALFPNINGSYSNIDALCFSMFVYTENGSVFVVLKCSGGRYLLFETYSNSQNLLTLCSQFSENGEISAVSGANTGVDSIMIYSLDSAPVYNVLASVYQSEGELSADVLSLFEINPHLVSVYRDGDTIVYLENSRLMQLHADGHVSFAVTDKNEGIPVSLADGQEKADALATASSLVFSLWGELASGDSLLSLSAIEATENGVIFYYEAYIGGRRVNTNDHSAAAVVVENSVITGVSVHPLRITAGENSPVIPYTAAAAAAPSGSYIRICYIPKADGTLSPVTVYVSEGSD